MCVRILAERPEVHLNSFYDGPKSLEDVFQIVNSIPDEKLRYLWLKWGVHMEYTEAVDDIPAKRDWNQRVLEWILPSQPGTCLGKSFISFDGDCL